MPVVSADVRA